MLHASPLRPYRPLFLALSSALALSACHPAPSDVPAAAGNTATGNKAADDQLAGLMKDPANWATYNGGTAEQRYSPLDTINAGNVAGLKLAWSYELDTNRGQESTPLAIDGKLYVTTAWSKVVALDGASGKPLWTYDPKVPPEKGFAGCCDVVNRGAAYYDGKIYVGTIDGRLIALDAASGKPVWSVQTTDPAQPYTITGAPRIVRGKVIIGNGGAEFGVRGYITAYDAESGTKVWRFYTAPRDPSLGPDGEISDEPLKGAAGTWFGKFWAANAGGTVWDSIVYDPDLNQLYIGTGNGSPWNHKIRSEGKGDNLFLSSIVALDPDTGKYKWHYQINPGESWDFTATQQITLADLTIDGKPRKVLMQAPKNGFFYVLDRTTGKLISAKNYGPVTWATGIDLKTGRPIENPDARYATKPFLNLPGGPGAHNWMPMAFSPKTNLVYIPAQLLGELYVNDPGYKVRPGTTNLGVDTRPTGMPGGGPALAAMAKMVKGSLVAWDPTTQTAKWTVDHGSPWNGGVLATGGNLVFQGTHDGQFQAYDAGSGKKLWNFATQSGVMAGPMSFAIGGKQYVAVVAGYGGAGIALPSFDGPHAQPNGRVLVFALDGTATLPAYTPQLGKITASAETWPADVVARGEGLYADNCQRCHTAGALSSGVLPDLRRSGALADKDAWKQIVIDGVLKEGGMISFSSYMDPAGAEAIRAYVATRAKQAEGK